MRQGLYTSGILHSFLGLVLITNFQMLENKPDELLSNVSVKLLSEQELMKLSEVEITEALDVTNFEPEKKVDVDRYPKKPEIFPKRNIGNEIKGFSEPDVIKIKKDMLERDVDKLVKTNFKTKKYIENGVISKTIFVKNKIINYIVK